MKRGRIKKPACAGILFLCMLALTGCRAMEETMQKLIPEEDTSYEETTLQVNADGTLMEEIVERLDQSYYNADELRALVDETVQEYNAANGADSVKVDAFTQEEGVIDLCMTYKDAAAYAAYNHVPAFNGSMLEAQMEGFLFLQDFKKVNDGASAEETISNAEPLSHKEYQVLVTDTSHAVQVSGKVRYVSANALVTDGKLARPVAEGEAAQQEQGLVLPSLAVYMEPGQGRKLSDDERESRYMYILYE